MGSSPPRPPAGAGLLGLERLLLRAASTNERFTGTRSSTPQPCTGTLRNIEALLSNNRDRLPSLKCSYCRCQRLPIIFTLASCHYPELPMVVRPTRARHRAYFKARNRRLLRKEEEGGLSTLLTNCRDLHSPSFDNFYAFH